LENGDGAQAHGRKAMRLFDLWMMRKKYIHRKLVKENSD